MNQWLIFEEGTFTPGKWHLMRLAIPGERVSVTVGDTLVEGMLLALDAKKRNVALNPGKAGDELTNFRAREAMLAKE